MLIKCFYIFSLRFVYISIVINIRHIYYSYLKGEGGMEERQSPIPSPFVRRKLSLGVVKSN